ncbi:hypothetical protein ACFL0P_02150 [Candidatus Omnitrophota bacterium]
MKNVKKIIKNLTSSGSKKVFYASVKCSGCEEEVKIRINRPSDFQEEYNPHNPEHCYTVKKEIIGKKCFNLMKLTLALTKKINVLFADAESCEFMAFDRE